MKFSLLIPTRERVQYLDNLVRNIYDRTTNKKDIEILFACDSDDVRSIDHLYLLKEKYKDSFDIQVHIRERTIFLNKDYYNWLAERANGEFLWVLGDDINIYVTGWDIIIYQQLTDFIQYHPDRIVCASIRDNTPKPSPHLPKFPCFPMFSKEVFQVSGMLLHPKIPTWGADYVAYETFFPIKRLLEITNEVFVNHISWHTRQVPIDNTNRRIGDIFNSYKNVPLHNIQRILAEEVPEIRQKLLIFIEQKQKEKVLNERVV